MKILLLLLGSCFASVLYASDLVVDATDDGAPTDSATIDSAFSEHERWNIKRQVMSRPGVMLDMANMTDNGYTWINDVVWAGDGLPIEEKWYVAGFLFQRPRYKSVWLQDAFRIDSATKQLRNVRRWYGAASIR